MNQIHSNKKFRVWVAFLCVLSMIASPLTLGASDVATLEQEANALSSELNDLNMQLSTLSKEITDLVEQIEQTAKNCEIAEFDVAAAKINEEHQYKAMEKRIQFMYEDGNSSLMEIILTAESMGDFLNKTQYVSSITEYDRSMLDELIAIHDDIAEKEQKLKDELEKLNSTQQELESKQITLNETIDSTSDKLDATSVELQEARRAQEAARIALEQQRAAEAAAAAAAAEIVNSGQTDGTTADGSSPDGTTPNETAPGTPAPTPAPPAPAPAPAPPVSAEASEVALFAGLLQAEAGSTNYDALLAVATVVMNRLESSRYAPSTIRGIIYQSGQFSPTWNGSLDRILARGPASLCYQVAQDAIGGARLARVSHCYSFRAASGGRQGIYIGDNVFF